MDIRQLSYFVEVVKHKSFSKAAEELHISQPNISKVVRILEDELGVTLLERSTKQVKQTDVGEIVFKQAQKILKSVADLTSEISDVTGLQHGHIKIGLPPMVGANFFPRVLAEFYNFYPKITIELIEDGALTVAQRVESGDLNLGVVVLPINEDIFDSFAFAVDQLMLIVHPGHPLADKTEVVITDLRDEPFILYRQDFTLHFRIQEQCLAHGFKPKVVFESSQWDFISEMVAANLGIALLPKTICKELNPRRIKAIPLTSPVIPWNLGLIWRKEKYLTYATKEFISFAKSHIGQMGTQK